MYTLDVVDGVAVRVGGLRALYAAVTTLDGVTGPVRSA